MKMNFKTVNIRYRIHNLNAIIFIFYLLFYILQFISSALIIILNVHFAEYVSLSPSPDANAMYHYNVKLNLAYPKGASNYVHGKLNLKITGDNGSFPSIWPESSRYF